MWDLFGWLRSIFWPIGTDGDGVDTSADGEVRH